MDRTRGPLMATVSRNGMTTTINGLTKNGKSGVAESRGINTVIDVGLVIAEAPRRGTSRLVDSFHLRRGSFTLCEVSHSGSCCLL